MAIECVEEVVVGVKMRRMGVYEGLQNVVKVIERRANCSVLVFSISKDRTIQMAEQGGIVRSVHGWSFYCMLGKSEGIFSRCVIILAC